MWLESPSKSIILGTASIFAAVALIAIAMATIDALI
jgi:hypothetical protein